MEASPCSACSRFIRFRTCERIETSSALTGSSATITFGFEHQRPGQRDPLALAAGELVRVALERVSRQADLVEQLPNTRWSCSLRLPSSG